MKPRIYRIRYIPSEAVELSSDELLYRDKQYLITEWKPINPRSDIAYGVSCVFLEHGWKVSAFLDAEKKLKYWYCDVIGVDYVKETDTYNLKDLLVDIIIKSDGKVIVNDLDELAEAYENGLITADQLSRSLRQCQNLLTLIYEIDLPTYLLDILRNCTNKEFVF